MAALSAAQIFGYAKGAGLSTADAIIATAVAFAESSGNPSDHYQPGTGEDSYGLWQINLDPSYRSQRMRELGITSPSQLYDPATNARAMAVISNHGKNWGPWTTYTSGKYKQFLGQAGAVSGSPALSGASIGGTGDLAGGGDIIGAINGITSSLKSFSDVMARAFQTAAWLANPVNDLRIISGIWGALIMLVGLLLLAWAA